MENQPPNNNPQNPAPQPVPKPQPAPAVQPAPTPATAPATQPAVPAPATQPAAKPATQPTAPVPVAQPTAPTAPAPQKPSGTLAAAATKAAAVTKNQSKGSRRLLIGCFSAFGCSLLLFIGVLFAFLGLGGDTTNPIFGFLGVPPGDVVNVLITLINFIFLILVFLTFIFVVIGIFKIAAAKKDDKEAKRKGSIFAFLSLAAMVLFIFLWVVAYFFLAPKRTATAVPTSPIITVPEKTTNLTAPVTISFDASKAPIKRTYDVLSYQWDFGDDSSAKGVKQTHTYTDLGEFKVTIAISVKEKATNKEETVSFTKDVTISNALAKVVIKADKKSGDPPLTVNFDGSDSSSPNGEITAYAWDLDADGEFDDGDSETAKATFDKIGTFTVSLRVTDSAGAPATGELEIEVKAPDNPVPVISVEGVTDTSLQTEQAYVFSAVQSVSPSGQIEKFKWEFGDGESATTRTATHIYKSAGEYDVTLKVEDSTQKKGEVTVRYSVKPQEEGPLASIKTKPEAAKDGTLSGQAPFEVAFDASGSQDPNNNIVEYAWDFDGDGKTDDTNAAATHTFLKAGTVTVSLTVTDAADLSSKAQIVLKVEAAGLKANIKADPIAGVAPLTVNFDATGSSYPDGSIVAYEWNFGDGSAPKTDAAKVSHQYTAIGTFTAKVTAITSDNKRAEAAIPINVRPVPLAACFASSAKSGKAPLQVQFDPTCSTGTVIKYRWNFGTGNPSTERKPSFTFEAAGEYSVTLEIADSANNIDTVSEKITVTP